MTEEVIQTWEQMGDLVMELVAVDESPLRKVYDATLKL